MEAQQLKFESFLVQLVLMYKLLSWQGPAVPKMAQGPIFSLCPEDEGFICSCC